MNITPARSRELAILKGMPIFTGLTSNISDMDAIYRAAKVQYDSDLTPEDRELLNVARAQTQTAKLTEWQQQVLEDAAAEQEDNTSFRR